MDKQLIDRVNLIMNTHFSFVKQKNDPHQQYKSSLIIQFISIIIVLIAVLCAWSAIQQVLSIHNNVPDWDSIAMMVAILFPWLFLVPQNFADFLLKKHMIDIIERKPKCNQDFNIDLKKTIASLSDRKNNFLFLVLPLVLVIASLLKILDLNPIWHIFAYIAPLCLILIAVKTFINYRCIKKSIARFEKGV